MVVSNLAVERDRWKEQDGSDAFSIFHVFAKDDAYLSLSASLFMINFRVDNLDELLQQLKDQGVKVYDKIEEEPYGRFGWFEDPNGTKVELWEPKKPSIQKS